MYHWTKGKIPVKLFFVQDMIIRRNYIADCKYIHQHKRGQKEKDVIRKKSTRIDYDYRVGY